jgi:hypothetical protein
MGEDDPAHLGFHFGLLVGSILFGASHIAAWSFAFPTATERLVWEISSLFCTLLPVLNYILYITLRKEVPRRVFGRRNTVHIDGRTHRFHAMKSKIIVVLYEFMRCATFVSIWLYIAARLYILVEIFRSLCFLPAGAYISTGHQIFSCSIDLSYVNTGSLIENLPLPLELILSKNVQERMRGDGRNIEIT